MSICTTREKREGGGVNEEKKGGGPRYLDPIFSAVLDGGFKVLYIEGMAIAELRVEDLHEISFVALGNRSAVSGQRWAFLPPVALQFLFLQFVLVVRSEQLFPLLQLSVFSLQNNLNCIACEKGREKEKVISCAPRAKKEKKIGEYPIKLDRPRLFREHSKKEMVKLL
jgi:hypothetical protein